MLNLYKLVPLYNLKVCGVSIHHNHSSVPWGISIEVRIVSARHLTSKGFCSNIRRSSLGMFISHNTTGKFLLSFCKTCTSATINLVHLRPCRKLIFIDCGQVCIYILTLMMRRKSSTAQAANPSPTISIKIPTKMYFAPPVLIVSIALTIPLK